MALQDTAQMACVVDGTFQVLISGISRTLETGQVEAMTLQGLVGFMATGGVCRVTLNYVKPASGSEFNFDKAASDGGYHDVQIFDGAETYVGNGKFIRTERSQNTGEVGSASVDFVGEPNAFE